MTPQLLNEAFLAKITIIKFFRVAVNMYVPIFRGLDARGGRNLQTDTQQGTTTVTLAVHMCTEGVYIQVELDLLLY